MLSLASRRAFHEVLAKLDWVNLHTPRDLSALGRRFSFRLLGVASPTRKLTSASTTIVRPCGQCHIQVCIRHYRRTSCFVCQQGGSRHRSNCWGLLNPSEPEYDQESQKHSPSACSRLLLLCLGLAIICWLSCSFVCLFVCLS